MGYQIEKWIEANQKKFDCKHPFGIIHPTRTRSSMDRASYFELCGKGSNPFHGGRVCPERSRRVNPLDGVNSQLSIESTKSTLSMLIAPQLHQKSALRADRMGTPYPTEDRSGRSLSRATRGNHDRKTGHKRSEYPFVSIANNRSLHSGRSRSDHSINWFGGLIILIYYLQSRYSWANITTTKIIMKSRKENICGFVRKWIKNKKLINME